jgi:uncharacterized protein YecT (DUF1311 family)
MQSIPRPRVLSRRALLAQLLLIGGIFVANAEAQELASVPEPPPPPVAFENRIPSDQLAFLSGYAGQPAKAVLKDKQFRTLLKETIPHTEYHYGRDMPLSEALDMVLDGSKTPVDVRDNRYVLVSGSNGPYLRGRGFVWFDLREGILLGGFYFQPTNGEPTPTFTVFSRQLKVNALSTSQLPDAFIGDFIQWATRERISPVTARYFIPDNGKKYVLLHDEDYCWHAENEPAPPQDRCQQMNADSADMDMNAAYFMQETHNQANATAWMLGPDQVAWIGMRDQTCGAGLSCRIRITRQRTRVLLGGGGGRRR